MCPPNSIQRLTHSIYGQEHKKRRSELTLNRILGKAFLNKAETNTVTSICSKALGKIEEH